MIDDTPLHQGRLPGRDNLGMDAKVPIASKRGAHRIGQGNRSHLQAGPILNELCDPSFYHNVIVPDR
jgi:hypothetical protein